MASAFPGMDPFLDSPVYWSDFHSTFINYWREAIADALPPQYEATLGERVYLVEHSPETRKLGYAGVATLEPITIPLAILEGPRETYIEILHQPDRSLVAALELLSPANKEQPGRTEYMAKRQALLFQKVHLVELDLPLGGQRVPLGKPLPAAHYYYFLSRGDQRPDCQVYFWTVRQPLPRLPVPLRKPDADVLIDLGAVFTTAYDRGRFRRRIDYHAPLPLSLSDGERRWCEAVGAGQG
jgi:hypothetical protein